MDSSPSSSPLWSLPAALALAAAAAPRCRRRGAKSKESRCCARAGLSSRERERSSLLSSASKRSAARQAAWLAAWLTARAPAPSPPPPPGAGSRLESARFQALAQPQAKEAFLPCSCAPGAAAGAPAPPPPPPLSRRGRGGRPRGRRLGGDGPAPPSTISSQLLPPSSLSHLKEPPSFPTFTNLKKPCAEPVVTARARPSLFFLLINGKFGYAQEISANSKRPPKICLQHRIVYVHIFLFAFDRGKSIFFASGSSRR